VLELASFPDQTRVPSKARLKGSLVFVFERARLSTITVEENRKRLELALPHGLGLCGMRKP